MIQQPELGKKVFELRKAQGITQEELVEKCNLSVRTLQRIESGEVTPRPITVKLIFEALGVSFDKAMENKGSIQKWLEQFYISFIDLFNLKTNTMKKISILTFVLIFISFFIFNSKLFSQTINSNPLLGKWKLVSINQKSLNSENSSIEYERIQIDSNSTRFLEFKSDYRFKTRTSQNYTYNSGVYSLINDSTFITVHFDSRGKLMPTSNLYHLDIQNDTLHFQGFFLSKTQILRENLYKEIYIDEYWVRLKK